MRRQARSRRSPASVESMCVASAVTAHPHAPSAKPTVITGVRPTRSIKRPAGTAVNPEDVRKIAGPSPSSPLTPVTSTNVSDETAAVNCRTAELTAIVAERITVLRRIGRSSGDPLATVSFNQAADHGAIASMAIVLDTRPSVVVGVLAVALWRATLRGDRTPRIGNIDPVHVVGGIDDTTARRHPIAPVGACARDPARRPAHIDAAGRPRDVLGRQPTWRANAHGSAPRSATTTSSTSRPVVSISSASSAGCMRTRSDALARMRRSVASASAPMLGALGLLGGGRESPDRPWR